MIKHLLTIIYNHDSIIKHDGTSFIFLFASSLVPVHLRRAMAIDEGDHIPASLPAIFGGSFFGRFRNEDLMWTSEKTDENWFMVVLSIGNEVYKPITGDIVTSLMLCSLIAWSPVIRCPGLAMIMNLYIINSESRKSCDIEAMYRSDNLESKRLSR